MDYKLILFLSLGVIAGVFLLVWALARIYSYSGDGLVKKQLGKLLYCMDMAADKLEILSSRAQVIMAIQQALAWKKIIIPGFVVGLLVDLFVWLVRKAGCPDLHQDKPKDEEGQP